MNFESKMKKRIDSNLDAIVPNPHKKKHTFPKWAKIALPITAGAVAMAAALPLFMFMNNLENVIGRLNGTHVDMDNVSAFAVWNAPKKKSKKPRLSNIAYIQRANEEESIIEGETSSIDEEVSLTPEQEWELDYDWDPTKANVLVSIDEDGGIKEVVYERTNNKGVVRQDVLGNAAAVYVSRGFTYVMYVDDSEWEFWKDINFAQESVIFNGFHCHHEEMQTIVIHNETGNVYALKDLIKQVSEISGALNYTMQVQPTYENYLTVDPMYGDSTTQWYRVKYDDVAGLRYEFVDFTSIDYGSILAVRTDVYGQEYVYAPSTVGNGYEIFDNSLLFGNKDEIMQGADGHMYTIIDNTLMVYGEGFELAHIESGLNVSMESIAQPELLGDYGVPYRLEDNHLYSAFGEYWNVDALGALGEKHMLSGSFPAIGTDCYLVKGEIIALVDAQSFRPYRSENGKLVHLKFGLKEGKPSVESDVILENAVSIHVQNHKITAMDGDYRTRPGVVINFYRVVVENGTPRVEIIAYGASDGRTYGVTGLAKPITEPLDVNY